MTTPTVDWIMAYALWPMALALALGLYGIRYKVYGIRYMVYGVYRLSKMKLTCVTRSWQLLANKTEGGTHSSG